MFKKTYVNKHYTTPYLRKGKGIVAYSTMGTQDQGGGCTSYDPGIWSARTQKLEYMFVVLSRTAGGESLRFSMLPVARQTLYGDFTISSPTIIQKTLDVQR